MLLLWAGWTPSKAEVPLIWFDRFVRSFGPALPFPILAARWCAPPTPMLQGECVQDVKSFLNLHALLVKLYGEPHAPLGGGGKRA